jgi:5'-3' exonuclease
MTAKEKAKELIDKFGEVEIMFESQTGKIKYDELWDASQKCALIAVDEILLVITECETEYYDNYWQQVKSEIENYKR